MPAKENVLLLSENETKLIRKDVDHLVQNIKDNLKLTYEAVSFEKGGTGGPTSNNNSAVKQAGLPGACSAGDPHGGLNVTDFSRHLLSPTSATESSLIPSSTTMLSMASSTPSLCTPAARKAKSYLSSRSSRASPYFIPGKVQSSSAGGGGSCSGSAGKCVDCNDDGGAGGGPHRGKKWSVAARKRYPSMSANGSKKLDRMEDPLEMLHELISEGNLLKEAVRRLQLGLSPKIQRNFYDSDEDCRTPPAIGVGYN